MVTSFIFGISMGIILHRLIMMFVLNEAPDSLCAYCKWLTQKTAWLSRKQTPAKLDRSRWEGCKSCDKVNSAYLKGAIYCVHCGRPLTEEAWTEMERRIGGNDGTTD